MKIIFATGNNDKLKEIRRTFEGTGYEIISMREAGFDGDIEECGETFEENSYIKAKAIWDRFGGLVMADDSGFMVDYLDGAPGVYSARYMGEDADYATKCAGILKALEGVPKEKRGASFVTVITAILPNGKKVVAEGKLSGIVNDKPEGTNGFGYDPILFVPELNKTTAQITLDEKIAISHRGKALRTMKEILTEEAEDNRWLH
ncbi:MAG: RdgB/HAM1 family non-canonical purine NTP pyrophosphatase [Lachnospiraceae bacterium]|nr:RdgB/HAM1 family non-canonical purine NTP pyrophosphatase [Lachnospiraceae bacterium]